MIFSTQPLAGMQIVEASAFVAAPLGGMTLAQLGADVVRIDPPGGGLDHQRWPVTQADMSLFWCGLNKGKRSVVIDTRSGEGRELAMALVTAPGCDRGMFLTNFPPRGWLSYETLKARRGDLVQVSLQGDRHGGSAVDYTVNARVGLPFLTGAVDSPNVVNHVLPAWDLIAGHMIAIGLLAAERVRSRANVGQHVKLALEDVALAMVSHLGLVAEAQLGTTRARHGNELFGAFGRDFVCGDGRAVMLVALTLKQWKSLCNATGIAADVEALQGRLKLNLNREGDRFRARKEIAQLLQPWFSTRPFELVRAILDEHAVCWGPYQTITDLVRSDPSCSPSNPMFGTVDQAGVGRLLVAGTPLDFCGSGRVEPRPAPALGEHTESVLIEQLGMTASQYGRLLDRGVVCGPSRHA